MKSTTHRGVWTPEQRAEQFYRYLPFEVPPGVAGVEVVLDYDRSAGVIDLGCVAPDGFRGWSGGARDRYVIGPQRATPGYLPGEPEPGEWHVMLGLHRIPSGVDYRVDVRILDTAPHVAAPVPVTPRSRPTPRALPAPTGMRWVAGDLHAHTEHSDGQCGVDALAADAAETGLDFLAVTDHNTVSHHPHLHRASQHSGVLLLPGQEVTTERGHANAFGDIGWIDFREPAQSWVDEVERRGGLLSVNHPIATDCAWRQPLTRRPRLAEIWHCTWRDRTWSGPLAWWLAWGADTVPVGGSDFHAPGRDRPLGEPTTWVCVPDGELTVTAVLDGMRAGRVALGADVSGPVLLRVEDELVAVDADGAILSDFSGRRRPVRGALARFPSTEGPCWLEDAATTILAIAPSAA